MKFLIVLNLISSFLFEFNKTSNSNKLKERAAVAFQSRQYMMAIRYYHELVSVYKIKDEGVVLNLAHAYFKMPDHGTASYYYKQVLHSSNRKIRCEVNHQLGVIAALEGKGKIALAYFREALKADDTNDAARFNYELLKKKMQNKKGSSAPNASQKNKRQASGRNGGRNKKGQEKQEAQGIGGGDYPAGQGEDDQPAITGHGKMSPEAEEAPASSDRGNGKSEEQVINEEGLRRTEALQSARFSEIHISEAKARMLLENMKNQELILLNRKRKTTQTNKDPDKPDW